VTRCSDQGLGRSWSGIKNFKSVFGKWLISPATSNPSYRQKPKLSRKKEEKTSDIFHLLSSITFLVWTFWNFSRAFEINFNKYHLEFDWVASFGSLLALLTTVPRTAKSEAIFQLSLKWKFSATTRVDNWVDAAAIDCWGTGPWKGQSHKMDKVFVDIRQSSWPSEGLECFYFRLFLEDLQYFIVTPHWMCTYVRRPLCFSSSLLLSEGTLRVPKPGIKPRTYQMAGRRTNHWATPRP